MTDNGNGNGEAPRKIAIICSKGSLDMAYPGLILANAARMMGIDAVLFFTFWGMDVIHDKRVDKLHTGSSAIRRRTCRPWSPASRGWRDSPPR